MTIIRPAALALAISALAVPALAQESTTVSVRDAEGTLVTELTLSDAGNGVLITGTVTGISPGAHAIHLHEVGECTPPFESAGGHYNPAGHDHGILNPDGHHAGDLPNIVMPEEGDGSIQIIAAGVTLASGADNSLRGGDGTAIVIHAGPDDYRTDPAGESGDRIACGVIE
jgi:Cu-Zn family superoxide dismutase